MSKLHKQIKTFPRKPGVYLFKNSRGSVLYVGKATNLRSRVMSYLNGNDSRGERIDNMVALSSKIDYIETDTTLEALILESTLIKKYQPLYNAMGKDDKSFSYLVITKEEYPRILIVRKRELEKKVLDTKIAQKFGPYFSKRQIELGLKILRKIFPYHSLNKNSEKGCLDYQIGRCPGPYDDQISKLDYRKNIAGIRMIFQGKKKQLIQNIERDMKRASKEMDYEKASKYRDQVFALKHIQEVALISDDLEEIDLNQSSIRIEAYDISNISGAFCVGSMVVYQNGKMDKSQYRKFKIKTIDGIDDVGAMREMLIRRFKNDWTLPDLIIIDGGKGHLSMGKKVIQGYGLGIAVVGVAKGPKRNRLDMYGDSIIQDKEVKNILKNTKVIQVLRDEAHRFAIQYHRKLREKI